MNTEDVNEQKKELVERAEILFDFQKEQYEMATDGLRRLEDKAMRTFSSLSIVITATLLIIRYWWTDIFSGKHDPLHYFCWFFLFSFIIASMISWGFNFSAMQLKDFNRPSSDPNKMEDFFMNNERYNSLSAYAKEYSKLTSMIDSHHAEKAKKINFCFEAIHYSAWMFIFFLISFILIKLTN
jgi:hypothetical protein